MSEGQKMEKPTERAASDSDCPRCGKYIEDLGIDYFADRPFGQNVEIECPHCGAMLDGFADVTYCLTDRNPPPMEEL